MNKPIFKVEKGQELVAKGSKEKFYKIKLVGDGREITIPHPYIAEYSAEKSDNGKRTLHYIIEKNNELVRGKIDFESAKVKVILDDNKYKLSICNSDDECIILPKGSLSLYRNKGFPHQHYPEIEEMLDKNKTPFSLKQYYGDSDSLTLDIEEGTYNDYYAVIKEKDGETLCVLYSYVPLVNEEGKTIAFDFKHANKDMYQYDVRVAQYATERNGEYGKEYYFSTQAGDPVDISGAVDQDLEKPGFYKSILYNASLENAIKDDEEVDMKLLEALKSCQEKLFKTEENKLETSNSSDTSNCVYITTETPVQQFPYPAVTCHNPYNYCNNPYNYCNNHFTPEVVQYSNDLYQYPCMAV